MIIDLVTYSFKSLIFILSRLLIGSFEFSQRFKVKERFILQKVLEINLLVFLCDSFKATLTQFMSMAHCLHIKYDIILNLSNFFPNNISVRLLIQSSQN